MTEMAVQHGERPKRRNGAELGPVLISGNRLAMHFGISRQHVERLAAQGVVERRADGLFDQDASRLKYLTHLRSENRRSPRTQADTDHVKVKTEMLQMRLMEKRRELVRREDVNELTDTMAGVVLTHLSGMAARCSRDLTVRREIDRVVYEVRTELAQVCTRMADERGEPPLDQQG